MSFIFLSLNLFLLGHKGKAYDKIKYRKSFSWDYSLTSLSQVGFSVITCHRLDRPTGVRGVSGMGSVTSFHYPSFLPVKVKSLQKSF